MYDCRLWHAGKRLGTGARKLRRKGPLYACISFSSNHSVQALNVNLLQEVVTVVQLFVLRHI